MIMAYSELYAPPKLFLIDEPLDMEDASRFSERTIYFYVDVDMADDETPAEKLAPLPESPTFLGFSSSDIYRQTKRMLDG